VEGVLKRSAKGFERRVYKGGGGGVQEGRGGRVSLSVKWLTWAWHALSAFDEVILEALVSAHLPGRQALMV